MNGMNGTVVRIPENLPLEEKTIKQGILSAGGTNQLLLFIVQSDFDNLGKELVKREVKHKKLLYMDVVPLNNIRKAIIKGKYTSVDPDIEKEVKLKKAIGSKRVYFVPVVKEVKPKGEEAYVNEYGVTLCKNSRNFLLGLMCRMSTKFLSTLMGGVYEDRIILAIGKKEDNFQGLCVTLRKEIIVLSTHNADWSGPHNLSLDPKCNYYILAEDHHRIVV